MFNRLFMVLIAALVLYGMSPALADDALSARRTEARRKMQDGNFGDAASIFRSLALDRAIPPKDAADDLRDAFVCLLRLHRIDEAETLLQDASSTRNDSWRMLYSVAWLRTPNPDQLGLDTPMQWNPRDTAERDRTVGIRLLLEAEKLFEQVADPATEREKASVYYLFSQILTRDREDGLSWRLTALTDLDAPPAADAATPAWALPRRGAPVDANGDPLYYSMPQSWDAAGNDGERWRWIVGRLAAADGVNGRDLADKVMASFLIGQFGVQTMTGVGSRTGDADVGGKTGPFAVRTLKETETIARLSTGIRRFSMPDEFNHILILRRLASSGSVDMRGWAQMRLAAIFENRQQYPRAVAFWEAASQTADGTQSAQALEALRRITGNNGLLEPGEVAPAGTRGHVSYLFRNGTRVAMSAKRLDEKKLLQDIRALLKSDAEKLFSDYVMQHPEMLGRMVVERGMDGYIAETTAEWEVSLSPLPDYFSSRARIELPFEQAGCYLVEAAMPGGNTSRLILWVSDLSLTRKSLGRQEVLYVADAVDGSGTPGATITFLGMRRTYDATRDRSRLEMDEFAERTDVDGLAVIPAARLEEKEWLITAETADGRLAYTGFDAVWSMDGDAGMGVQETSFIITDRPVYRPNQEIHFNIWHARASYHRPSGPVAGKALRVQIRNPRGETIYDKKLVTDENGGIADTLVLDASAPLGGYYITAGDSGVGFRLEEYKKPEFAVTVEAPERALILGDSARVAVRAKYYYGEPVADARVSYKIIRTPFEQSWLPPWRWDWLFGEGSWRISYDYSWYPGWKDWCYVGPRPSWLPSVYRQPEVVADGEGELDADGVFRLTLDTALAKELFGNQDHSYAITAEVTDRSRRTIIGSGTVIAARKPFSVSVWTDRGFYRTGQEMRLAVNAMLPAGGGIKTDGKAALYRIRYDADGMATETGIGSWDIATDASGSGSLRLTADAPGQYRLACAMRDADGNTVEGGALLTIRGEDGEGDFRFSALELIPDQREYQPGDVVHLAVNSENRAATVLLFPRVERLGGDSFPERVRPDILRLDNGSRIIDIPVGEADQPNFFCDALTIFNGRLYAETREIFVPPAARTLNVSITPDQESYAPGARAEFTVKVTDDSGRPVEGRCVVTLYDKAVEYISGGTNVGDIRAGFWGWKRYRNSALSGSLDKAPYAVTKEGDVPWEPLGVFGWLESDWNDPSVYANGRLTQPVRPRAGAGFSGKDMLMKSSRAVIAGAPVPAGAPMADAYAGGEGVVAFAAETGGGDEAAAVVRSDFADTAYWNASLQTDAAGNAAFSLVMPENLTAWKARGWVMASETRVGEAQTEVVTRKNIIIRPQTPRFLTQKDTVVLSANLHNYLPRSKKARAELVLEGGLLELAENTEPGRVLDLPAGGEARVDWIVSARRPGQARVVMKLMTDEESDAAEVALPVIIHGARRVESFGGAMRGDDREARIVFRVPEERLPEQSRFEFSFSPTIAGSMLDALPFLIEYPYGCTEQTVNRFVPAVMTRAFLEQLGATLEDARNRIENAPVDAQSEAWKSKWGDPRSAGSRSPVFDSRELANMVASGVERLAAMQNADGGWGWFSGSGERSWPHTTAVVVHGLAAARDNGAAIPMGMLEQGNDWLRAYQNEQIERLKTPPDAKDAASRHKAAADNLDAFIYMILAEQGRFHPDMRDFLYRDRLRLSLSGLSMLGIALRCENATIALDMVLQNLSQHVERDPEAGTAWLRTPASGWWWWYNDSVETQAWYLKLLAAVSPRDDITAGLAKHLLRSRKNGSYWRSTRDTAYALEALSEYAVASGETAPDMTVDVYLDGNRILQRVLTADNLLDDNRIVLEGLAVEPGEHEIRLVRTGSGAVYYGGGVSVFSLEDPIAGTGLELKVERSFYKLVRDDTATVAPSSSGRAVAARTEHYRRERIPGPFDASAADTVRLESGDLVEVELAIEAKNDCEYLVFEDMKAAGLEAVELQSGYSANALGAYVEYRDQKVVLFVRYLPKGVYTVRYRFRAEIPGWFSALPAFGGGMYATDLFANSDEMKLRIRETGVFE